MTTIEVRDTIKAAKVIRISLKNYKVHAWCAICLHGEH